MRMLIKIPFILQNVSKSAFRIQVGLAGIIAQSEANLEYAVHLVAKILIV